jgi:uncharacterized membrane protein YccC
MNWIVTRIKGIMLIAGVLTSTMLYAAVAPQAALESTFGEGVDGPVAEIVVRNWGALIGLVGAMLIYGAYHPSSRQLVLTVAGLSKVVFIGLVLSHGARYIGHQAGIAVVVDSLFVLLFGGYLVAASRVSADEGASVP